MIVRISYSPNGVGTGKQVGGSSSTGNNDISGCVHGDVNAAPEQTGKVCDVQNLIGCGVDLHQEPIARSEQCALGGVHRGIVLGCFRGTPDIGDTFRNS